MMVDVVFATVAVVQYLISLLVGYLMGKLLEKPKGFLYEIVFVCGFFSILISMLIAEQVLGNMSLMSTAIGFFIGFFISDLGGDKKNG